MVMFEFVEQFKSIIELLWFIVVKGVVVVVVVVVVGVVVKLVVLLHMYSISKLIFFLIISHFND